MLPLTTTKLDDNHNGKDKDDNGNSDNSNNNHTLLVLVFEGPVHTTAKKPQLNRTEPQKNRTVSCSSGFS